MTFSEDFFQDLFSTNLSTQCNWLPANQFLFQMANIFLVFTYFVKPNGLFGLIQLRASLTMAGLCFGIWGGMVICSFDCMLWNSAFAIGNAVHLGYLMFKMKPKRFNDDQEILYRQIFKPVGVKRFQFCELVKIVNLNSFRAGEYYAKQGITESDHIGILLEGSFEVLLGSRPISHVNKFEFVDSPEWLSMNEEISTKYQVSLAANEESKVFQWKRQDLMKLFKNDVIIKNIFDLLIGKDICKKLFSLHQTFLMHDSSNVSEQLKQASLLTYSAANLETHPSSLPNTQQSPLATTRSVEESSRSDEERLYHMLQNSLHNNINITNNIVNNNTNDQFYSQNNISHKQQQLVMEDSLPVLPSNSEYSPRKSTSYHGYNLINNKNQSNSDQSIAVEIRDSKNRFSSSSVKSDDRELLFRETDL